MLTLYISFFLKILCNLLNVCLQRNDEQHKYRVLNFKSSKSSSSSIRSIRMLLEYS
jgi:hypothetical protein